MDKRGAILIGRYYDYYYRRLFYSNVSFWFHIYCFLGSVVFFTSSETSLHWSQRLLAWHLQCKVRLIHCKVLLYCIYTLRGFEVIVMFQSYSDSLIFLLIDLLPAKAEPASNRSLTNFLILTVM